MSGRIVAGGRRVLVVCSLAALAWGCGARASSGPPDAGGGSGADAGVDAPVDLCVGGSLCGTPASCCASGNECVEDLCLAACASGVRCGADLQTCCDAGSVCLENACVVPGAACGDPYDCEPGTFCEPTVGQCLPQPDPLTCKVIPAFDSLSVTTEWSLTADQILSIPVIANLDGAGAPEMVVNVVRDNAGTEYRWGRIQILDGATGLIKVGGIPHNPPTSYGSLNRASIATGDVSGDGLPDVLYASRPDASGKSLIVAIDGTGALLWTSRGASNAAYPISVENAAITLANFDADPMAEIVVGATLLDHDGRVLWDQGGNGAGGFVGTNAGYNGGIAAVADLDGDGKPEIVTGKQAWKVAWSAGPPAAATVTSYWTYPGDDGYPAIADFDRDGTPEVALVGNGKVHVLDGQTGQLFCAVDPTDAMCVAQPSKRTQPIAIPGGTTQNRGGTPTVADFDGDGRPEIGVAGGHSYSVYDLARPGESVAGITPTPAAGALFVRWSRGTQDLSSNASGSSVFDFQGDGAAEVVYQDECNVWVYSGTDGTTQLQLPNTNGTIHEYPLVVDADGDGNSEIVVVASDGGAMDNCPGQTPTRGVYVLGDPNDRWVPTRKVWTQHSYHVTNATAVGNVPLTETANWTSPGLNDYRKNAQGEGVYNAPDLAVELSVGLEACDAGQLVLKARVTNLGALGVYPGVTVEFRKASASGAVLGTGTTAVPLLPGGSTTVSITVSSSEGPDFHVSVDGASAVVECDELNNADATTGAHCPAIL